MHSEYSETSSCCTPVTGTIHSGLLKHCTISRWWRFNFSFSTRTTSISSHCWWLRFISSFWAWKYTAYIVMQRKWRFSHTSISTAWDPEWPASNNAAAKHYQQFRRNAGYCYAAAIQTGISDWWRSSCNNSCQPACQWECHINPYKYVSCKNRFAFDYVFTLHKSYHVLIVSCVLPKRKELQLSWTFLNTTPYIYK